MTSIKALHKAIKPTCQICFIMDSEALSSHVHTEPCVQTQIEANIQLLRTTLVREKKVKLSWKWTQQCDGMMFKKQQHDIFNTDLFR